MSLTCGFYNSDNDRKYNALQISSIFDGIISNGVYHSIGDAFTVKANVGMKVMVGEGRAWFNHTWTYNDSLYPIDVDPAEVVLDRITTIVLKIDNTRAVRNNTLIAINGTPASSPKPPTLTETSEVHYKPLADIYIKSGTTEIKQENITNRVGSKECPFVTGIIDSVSIEKLTAQWQDQFNRMFADLESKIEQVVSGTIIDGAVTNSKIANSAVTGDKLAANSVTTQYLATVLLSNWSGNTATISVPGIKTTDTLIADLNMTGASDKVKLNTEWQDILDISCQKDGIITVTTKKKPSLNMPIKLLAVRK